MSGDELLAEQRRYYAARAPEYDDWWFRDGRYELSPEFRAQWDADVAQAEAALDAFGASGNVLELAAGTGIWTKRLSATASRVVAVDASSEVVELNRKRTRSDSVEYVVADVFDWQPQEQFDVCFFSFWHSHVPLEHFDDFWALVADALAPSGRFFLIDSGFGDAAHVKRRKPDAVTGMESTYETRQLSDGRAFRIVKRYWDPAELTRELEVRGWQCEFHLTRYDSFLYGSGTR